MFVASNEETEEKVFVVISSHEKFAHEGVGTVILAKFEKCEICKKIAQFVEEHGKDQSRANIAAKFGVVFIEIEKCLKEDYGETTEKFRAFRNTLHTILRESTDYLLAKKAINVQPKNNAVQPKNNGK